ncbi:MAG TPA: hypothetical protein PLH92_17180 [Mycobacterium sp.]|uniref:hypothetical protein n=1 Tax=Mycolicibacterium sp. TaxID=2320850 RepID=UPI0025F1F507|nr:hypothetical protein [Mycolicibacterium sp.]HPX37531.1 hypothetical protein [Mycobacterium sp.]HQC78441.1 hypothetical protein [Mycobacterium sp.]
MAEWAAELDVDERMFMTDAPSPAPKYRDVREYLTELERRGLHQPETIEDLLNQTVGKLLDQFDISHELYRRWEGR